MTKYCQTYNVLWCNPAGKPSNQQTDTEENMTPRADVTRIVSEVAGKI